MPKSFYFYYKNQFITFHYKFDRSSLKIFDASWSDEIKVTFNGSWDAECREIGREIEAEFIRAFHDNFTDTDHFDDLKIEPQYGSASSANAQTVWSNNLLAMNEQNGMTTFSPDKRWEYCTARFYSSILTFIERHFDDDIYFDKSQLRKYHEFRTHFTSNLWRSISSTSQKHHYQYGCILHGDGFIDAMNSRKEMIAGIKQGMINDINDIILAYENSGRKFHLFAQDADRANAIKELTDDLKLLLDSDMSIIKKNELQLSFAVLIQRAIKHTIKSHHDKLGPALFGITKSRLQRQLTDYLHNFLQTTGIPQTKVNEDLAIKKAPLPIKYPHV